MAGLDKRLVIYGRVQRDGADLEELLRDRGFQVYAAQSEAELLDIVGFSQPDIVLLSGPTNLPMVARLIAESQRGANGMIAVLWPGIVADTAVNLLDMGVDYVANSFQPDWLAGQMRACLRRFGRERSPQPVIDLGRLRIDLQQRVVTVNDQQVSLTPTEFAVLRVLCERPGTVLPSGEIMQRVLGGRISESEAQDLLKVHIHRLRQKLEPDTDQPRFIRTVRGHGYMYAFERRAQTRGQPQDEAS